VLVGLTGALTGGIVRQDVMFIEDVWYGERILGSAGSADAILPEPRERQRSAHRAKYPAPTLMEYLEKE